ncbi:SDR family NAD(P)-dependent oxidoreductase [Frondihabitans cladoniiphilus]|uniref:SDR family oxidoreductase n=1 Tax=Frondihabitans cladoniiphilus TaxID=715785 RepID=A0ABP8WD28_9MICO
MSNAYEKLDLTGRSIVVTGAATGMGHASAVLFAARGALLTLGDINDEAGEALVAEISEAGGTATFVHTDVSNSADAKALVDAAVTQYGGLHGAFNNAGIGPVQPLHETSDELWQRIIGINLTGIFNMMKHEIAYFLEHGNASIVNTASLAGVKSVFGMGAYVASKHGVVGLTRAASQEYAARGIRVNAILPALIKTPMLDATGPVGEELEKGQPIGHAGEPEDIAEQAAWLLSDASAYSTGSLYAVDGGSNSI